MSKRTKFLLSIGVIAALVVGWQVVAFAASLPGSDFEIDDNANLKLDDGALCRLGYAGTPKRA